MKAELRPLEGKYYGTDIAIYDRTDHFVGGMNIWLNPMLPEDYEPSDRTGMGAQDICDNHYECALTLTVANKIVEAING